VELDFARLGHITQFDVVVFASLAKPSGLHYILPVRKHAPDPPALSVSMLTFPVYDDQM
jgi:hypothetical protein